MSARDDYPYGDLQHELAHDPFALYTRMCDEIDRWRAECDKVGVAHDPELLVRHHRNNGALIGAAEGTTEALRQAELIDRLQTENCYLTDRVIRAYQHKEAT